MRIHVKWLRPKAYYPLQMRWKQWAFCSAHDSESWFWRILGLEVTVRR